MRGFLTGRGQEARGTGRDPAAGRRAAGHCGRQSLRRRGMGRRGRDTPPRGGCSSLGLSRGHSPQDSAWRPWAAWLRGSAAGVGSLVGPRHCLQVIRFVRLSSLLSPQGIFLKDEDVLRFEECFIFLCFFSIKKNSHFPSAK